MTTATPAEAKILDYIARAVKPEDLAQVAKNADAQGNARIADAARRRRFDLLAVGPAGSLARDVWTSVHGLEDALSAERGRTTRLTRTRQMIAKTSEREVIAALVAKAPATDGYDLLIARGMHDLTFEAVALRHPDQFDADVLSAATARLESVQAAA